MGAVRTEAPAPGFLLPPQVTHSSSLLGPLVSSLFPLTEKRHVCVVFSQGVSSRGRAGESGVLPIFFLWVFDPLGYGGCFFKEGEKWVREGSGGACPRTEHAARSSIAVPAPSHAVGAVTLGHSQGHSASHSPPSPPRIWFPAPPPSASHYVWIPQGAPGAFPTYSQPRLNEET